MALTQAVVSIVGQHEAVEAGAPVVPRDVDALVDAAPVVGVILALVDVCGTRERGAREASEAQPGVPSPRTAGATQTCAARG